LSSRPSPQRPLCRAAKTGSSRSLSGRSKNSRSRSRGGTRTLSRRTYRRCTSGGVCCQTSRLFFHLVFTRLTHGFLNAIAGRSG